MVLYSIVDVADVLTEAAYQPMTEKINIRKINGGFVECQRCINGVERVKRLYSTDPALYLDKRYYPF